MAKINFTKVVGTGNDFIVVDNRNGNIKKSVKDLSRFAGRVCHRKFSIGADGVLVLERSRKEDFKMRIFNSDGSEADMCGNGARCAVLYARSRGWCSGSTSFETGAGIIKASVNGGLVKLKMTDPSGLVLNKKISIGGKELEYHFINTGVPHAVIFVRDVESFPVKEIGEKVRFHKAFKPAGTNVNFVKMTGHNRIRVRTYERGVEDETLACGTGSVASGIIAHYVKRIPMPARVLTSSGETLTIYGKLLDDSVSDVYLEGPCRIVYEGGIDYV